MISVVAMKEKVFNRAMRQLFANFSMQKTKSIMEMKKKIQFQSSTHRKSNLLYFDWGSKVTTINDLDDTSTLL